MKKDELKRLLLIERDKLASKTFEELANIKWPIVYEYGDIKDKNFYYIEADIIERTDEYIDIVISTDDAKSFWRSLSPITTGFIVHKDGRVEKYKKI